MTKFFYFDDNNNSNLNSLSCSDVINNVKLVCTMLTANEENTNHKSNGLVIKPMCCKNDKECIRFVVFAVLSSCFFASKYQLEPLEKLIR